MAFISTGTISYDTGIGTISYVINIGTIPYGINIGTFPYGISIQLLEYSKTSPSPPWRSGDPPMIQKQNVKRSETKNMLIRVVELFCKTFQHFLAFICNTLQNC